MGGGGGYGQKEAYINALNQISQFREYRIQESSEGVTIPVVYGTNRIAGNLLWVGDYKIYAYYYWTGGKGGGGGDPAKPTQIFTKVSLIIALCEGKIGGIGRVWKDKENDVFSNSGFSLKYGTYPQSPWSYLTSNHPTEALCYPGIAYVMQNDLDLKGNNIIPNFSFEIKGLERISDDIKDADPRDIIESVVHHEKYGLGLSLSYFDLEDYSIWCYASDLLLSPVFNYQRPATEHIQDLLDHTFSTCRLHNGSVIQMIPYADTEETAHGKTWIPNVTPLYDLDDDDFLSVEGDDPVKMERRSPADRYNSLRIEVMNRTGHEYGVTICQFFDQGSIDSYMLREDTTKQMHHICVPSKGRKLVQLMGQRALYIANIFKFQLTLRYQLLEVMDIVTLTDTGLGLNKWPVRITYIEENEDYTLSFEAEDFPQGVGHAALYEIEDQSGYEINYNQDPGDINEPVIFTAPGKLTASGYEIWAAISGGGEYWGGCDVFVSTDGETYKFVARLFGPSRYGVLSAQLPYGSDPDTEHTCSIDLTVSKGGLFSGTQDDADKFITACLVEDEIISFQTATLTAAYKYDLTYLRRGGYNSTIATHASDSRFVRLDSQIAKIPFDPNLIGKTIYVKFCSFNVWTHGMQSLADVDPYEVIPGPSLSYPSNPVFLRNPMYGDYLIRAGCNFEGPYPDLWWYPCSDDITSHFELRCGSTWETASIFAELSIRNTSYKWTEYPVSQGPDITCWIAIRDREGNYSQIKDSIRLINSAPDMSGVEVTAQGVKHGKKKNVTVKWKNYVEPSDLDHYDIYGSLIHPCPITEAFLRATVGKGTKTTKILGLPLGQYDWRVVPADIFRDGPATESPSDSALGNDTISVSKS